MTRYIQIKEVKICGFSSFVVPGARRYMRIISRSQLDSELRNNHMSAAGTALMIGFTALFQAEACRGINAISLEEDSIK